MPNNKVKKGSVVDMSILVTGGAGFIGSHTTVELLKAGREIVMIDNFSNSKPEVLEQIKKITGKDFKFYEILQGIKQQENQYKNHQNTMKITYQEQQYYQKQ